MKEINRRDFLKAVGALAFAGIQPENRSKVEQKATKEQILPSEIRLVQAGKIIAGDVEISADKQNWEVLYDDKQETGTIVDLKANAYIQAPWGAGLVSDRPAFKVAIEMLENGCGCPDGGCQKVDIYTWEGTFPIKKRTLSDEDIHTIYVPLIKK